MDILTYQGDMQTLREAENVNEQKTRTAVRLQREVKSLQNRYTDLVAKIRQAALDFIPGLFALILGTIVFLNNGYVTSLVTLNIQDVMILFGLGAGISAVKLVFDRS